MNLVVDASVAIAAIATPLGFERLRAFALIAPPLLWIEAESVLHATAWRGEIDAARAIEMRDRLRVAPVAPTSWAGRRPTTPTTWRSPASTTAAS